MAQFFTPFISADAESIDLPQRALDRQALCETEISEAEYASVGTEFMSGQRPNLRGGLFTSDLGDFALIGSIFRVIGTPTLETWPVSYYSFVAQLTAEIMKTTGSHRFTRFFSIHFRHFPTFYLIISSSLFITLITSLVDYWLPLAMLSIQTNERQQSISPNKLGECDGTSSNRFPFK